MSSKSVWLTLSFAVALLACVSLPIAAQTATGSGSFATPSASGIADWHDATGQCKPYRGVINITDCGVVADGAWIPGGCHQTAPVGCYESQGGHGADNDAGLRRALTAIGSQGGTIYFPNSGTNVWMFGGHESDDCQLNSNTGYYGLFSLPNNLKLVGQGRWVTTLMVNPGNGSRRPCWMFQPASANMFGVFMQGIRLDGNEITSSSKTDFLHPNNNGSSNTGRMGGLYFPTGAQIGGPAFTAHDFAFTGFQGNGNCSTSSCPFAPAQHFEHTLAKAIKSHVLNLGFLITGSGWIELSDGLIGYNGWSTWLAANPDSQYHDVYWQLNGSWNGQSGIQFWYGGTSFTNNYFGGGGGGAGTSNVLFVGAQGVKATNTVFDNSLSDNLRFINDGSTNNAYHMFSNSLFSQAGTSRQPSPHISIEGTSTNLQFANTWMNIGPGAALSTGIQETDSACNDSFTNTTFNSLGSVTPYTLCPGSKMSNTIGANDWPHYHIYGSARLSFGSIAPGSAAAATIAVPGATAAAVAISCIPQGQILAGDEAISQGVPYITSTDTVKITLWNHYDHPVTPKALTWSCDVTM